MNYCILQIIEARIQPARNATSMNNQVQPTEAPSPEHKLQLLNTAASTAHDAVQTMQARSLDRHICFAKLTLTHRGRRQETCKKRLSSPCADDTRQFKVHFRIAPWMH